MEITLNLKLKPADIIYMTSAEEKLKAYETEIRRKRVRTALYGTFVFVTTIFVIMLCSGDRFNRYLAFFGISGISNQVGGVYADCSLEENKNNTYCQAKTDASNREWDRVTAGGRAPFTLYDKAE